MLFSRASLRLRHAIMYLVMVAVALGCVISASAHAGHCLHERYAIVPHGPPGGTADPGHGKTGGQRSDRADFAGGEHLADDASSAEEGVGGEPGHQQCSGMNCHSFAIVGAVVRLPIGDVSGAVMPPTAASTADAVPICLDRPPIHSIRA